MNKKLFLKRILADSIIFIMFLGMCAIIISPQTQIQNSVKNENTTIINDSGTNIASSSTNSDLYDSQWPMFHGQLNHTGSVAMKPYTMNSSIVWDHLYLSTYGYTSSSPAISNGYLYVGSNDDNMYCLNATTGAFIWNYTTGNSIESSPAVANGFVYVGSKDDNVYCLNATTGALKWNYTTGNFIESSPAVANGFVYVGSADDNFYCLNSTTGTLKWNYTTGNAIESSPAIADGYVFFGSSDGYVYSLNMTTGSLYWKCVSPNSFAFGSSSPAIANGYLYIGGEGGDVFCFIINQGSLPSRLIWKYTTGFDIESSPAVSDGFVYIGSEDGNFYCLNATTGALVWKYDTYSNVDSSPAVSDGFVYFGDGDDKICCFNATSGELLWNYNTYNIITSSPAIANGYVYFCCSGGTWHLEGVTCFPMMFIPAAPQNLQATIGNGQVTLNWSAPVVQYGTSVTGYEIYRGTSLGNVTYLVSIGDTLNYTDTGLKNEQTYYYEVKAITGSGYNGYLSSIVNATPSAFPTAPTDVKAVAGNRNVTLSWQPPSYTAGSTIISYKIYRSTTSGSEVYLITVKNASTFLDLNLTNGQTYYYKISAVNTAGEGALSTEVQASPFAPKYISSPSSSPNKTIGGSNIFYLFSASLIGIIAVTFSLKKHHSNCG